MAIKLNNGWYKCLFCDFKARSVIDVDDHRDQEHDFFLVPLLKEDLARLVQFIMTGETELISERLYLTLKNYANAKPEREVKIDQKSKKML